MRVDLEAFSGSSPPSPACDEPPAEQRARLQPVTPSSRATRALLRQGTTSRRRTRQREQHPRAANDHDAAANHDDAVHRDDYDDPEEIDCDHYHDNRTRLDGPSHSNSRRDPRGLFSRALRPAQQLPSPDGFGAESKEPGLWTFAGDESLQPTTRRNRHIGRIRHRAVHTVQGRYLEQRSYPLGSLFGNITGYFDQVDQAAPYGIEAEYNSYLTYHQNTLPGLAGVLTTTSGTDSVVLTISKKLQQVAASAIAAGCPGEPGGCQEGAGVVAFDPQNGDILAMYGTPTYDPSLLASHDSKEVAAAYKELSNPTPGPYRKGGEGNSPLINYPTQQVIAPGSTMKVITTSRDVRPRSQPHDQELALRLFDQDP